ncbi:ABC transporter substrate-binding protein [Gelidibacter mesophilus]|uniref:ABC transporter substrate-binding protein n=1 Tax=Gelidibacter mesophilus TaxID=169050 RepID=UPI0004281C23|nr:helical backbone metal receptor [Gelidibacter mesophilus]
MRDQLHRQIVIDKTPKRIISLVPSQTELLVDLGLEVAIVGITKFCAHPHHLKTTKTIVGGTKQVHFDKIKALNPDIILCNKEENTKEMIQELEHIAPTHISDVNTFSDALELIDLYGTLFSTEKIANQLVEAIAQKKSNFEAYLNDQTAKNAAYFIWKEPWMVAAKDTFIDEMMQLNGFENYFGNETRYPEIILDKAKTESAEFVLLSTEPFPFKQDHIQTIQPYFPNAKIMVVDGEMFSWYGSRLMKAFDYFKTLQEESRSI